MTAAGTPHRLTLGSHLSVDSSRRPRHVTMSDTVIVMDEGKVVVEARPDEVSANPRVIEAYLGRHAGDDE